MSGIRWSAPEFEHRPKTAAWYWTTIIVAVVMLAFSLWKSTQADTNTAPYLLFGVFVIVGEILVIVWGAAEPPIVHFELTEKGLKVGERRFYPMRELQSFSADLEGTFDEAYPDVVLTFNHHFRTPLRMKVPMAWLPEVRRELRAHIPEHHFEPGFMEILEKYLGF